MATGSWVLFLFFSVLLGFNPCAAEVSCGSGAVRCAEYSFVRPPTSGDGGSDAREPTYLYAVRGRNWHMRAMVQNADPGVPDTEGGGGSGGGGSDTLKQTDGDALSQDSDPKNAVQDGNQNLSGGGGSSAASGPAGPVGSPGSPGSNAGTPAPGASAGGPGSNAATGAGKDALSSGSSGGSGGSASGVSGSSPTPPKGDKGDSGNPNSAGTGNNTPSSTSTTATGFAGGGSSSTSQDPTDSVMTRGSDTIRWAWAHLLLFSAALAYAACAEKQTV